MKYLLLTFILGMTLSAEAAGTAWFSYPTTNSMGDTDTLMTGNGATNLTITAADFGTSRTQPLINTSSNALFGTALTQINTTSNSLNTSINTASNSVLANAQTRINTSSNSVVTNLPPRSNYPALTNTITGLLGQVLMNQAHLDTNGSPVGQWTNAQMVNLEFHINTNAFTNIVIGTIGPLTNINGFVFYIPVGTNAP